MLRRLRERCTRLEGGFALIELLVVILIIGILAAIAIPAYTEHTKKGHDTEAKENVRNLASQVEFCFAPNENFQDCDTREDLDPVIGVPYGTGPGEAYVKSATQTTYVIEAKSKATTGSNHVFTLERNINGTSKRTCRAGPGNDRGACNSGKW